MLKEVREDPSKYGIGQTGSGGSRGMAVLEGVVAAVEVSLRDTLLVVVTSVRAYCRCLIC